MLTLRRIAVCCLVGFQASSLFADDPEPPTISVSGAAEVRVIPDHAVLRFSIDSRAVELAVAVADNDEFSTNFLTDLFSKGLQLSFRSRLDNLMFDHGQLCHGT